MPLGIGNKEKARTLDKLSPKLKRELLQSDRKESNSAEKQGYYCTKIVEPVPYLNKADCEKVIKHENNQWIVFGRDRWASRASGYGGEGHTHCGMIDIVVGRMGLGAESGVFANPNFVSDAARIYISQKCDIDDALGLAKGTVGRSKARSSIGMKADAVRIVGREGVKITTSAVGDTNSSGGEINTIYGIDLMAGNDDNMDTYLVDGFPRSQMRLQPIVKAFELSDCLVEIADPADGLIGALAGLLDTFLQAHMTNLGPLGTHTHVSPGFGSMTPPSVDTVVNCLKTLMDDLVQVKKDVQTFKLNCTAVINKYAKPSGSRWIGSRHNRTN
jgi:hypothetical protein